MRAPIPTLSLLAPLLLVACGDPAPTYVDQAWVRVSPNKDSPSAGYFTAHAGETAVTLRGVLTDRALRVEMHESVNEGGVMKMKPIDSVDIPAKGKVVFAPGGKHIMLWGVNPDAVAQGKMPLTFLFSNGDRIIVDAVVQKPGAAAAAGGGPANEHEGH
ncbi:copper chaperone PCu(A)C [Sphingobium sp. AN641]|uniref:copper chaperone PCu(A)C n=1 Tax=Sphingobium sp. AN641 TaxID=3133443 RepID=UPI0030C1410D